MGNPIAHELTDEYLLSLIRRAMSELGLDMSVRDNLFKLQKHVLACLADPSKAMKYREMQLSLPYYEERTAFRLAHQQFGTRYIEQWAHSATLEETQHNAAYYVFNLIQCHLVARLCNRDIVYDDARLVPTERVYPGDGRMWSDRLLADAALDFLEQRGFMRAAEPLSTFLGAETQMLSLIPDGLLRARVEEIRQNIPQLSLRLSISNELYNASGYYMHKLLNQSVYLMNSEEANRDAAAYLVCCARNELILRSMRMDEELGGARM